MSRVSCPGTRGPMDVVEVPSHLLEHFARAPAVLAAAARHWRTQAPPPAALLQALQRREQLFGALRLQQQACRPTREQVNVSIVSHKGVEQVVDWRCSRASSSLELCACSSRRPQQQCCPNSDLRQQMI